MTSENAAATANTVPAAGGDTVVDTKMFRSIGLYQLLWPAPGTGDGHRRYRATYATVVWLLFGVQAAQVFRLYAARDDPRRFAYVSVTMMYSMMCLYKGRAMAGHADGLRSAMDAAGFTFTAHGRGGRDADRPLRQCRAAVSAWLRPYLAVSCCTALSWIAQPWLMGSEDDGPWTATRRLIFVTEAFAFVVNMLCWTQFDCYLVTVCSALHAQFRVMAAGYETLGRRLWPPSPRTPLPPSDTQNTRLENYDELILYIKDNQNIIKKYDDLFDIVQPVVMVQIYIGSFSVVTIIFLTLLEYMIGDSASAFKYFMGVIIITIQLYMHCFAQNYLEIAKSEVNFGLYSSDWTAMDLRFKKTLLLAMNMNSAHKRAMKVTPESIVNMEMFTQVIKTSYTIVSVLLNMST